MPQPIFRLTARRPPPGFLNRIRGSLGTADRVERRIGLDAVSSTLSDAHRDARVSVPGIRRQDVERQGQQPFSSDPQLGARR